MPRPYESTPLVKYIARRIWELSPRKTQSQIATEAGFTQVNMLAMIKSGASKLPLNRVIGLAAALECDAGELFIAADAQSGKDAILPLIEEIFGRISANEFEWLAAIREFSGNTDPKLIPRRKKWLRHLFEKLELSW